MSDLGCLKCGKEILRAAMLCPYCGEILPKSLQNIFKLKQKEIKLVSIQKHWRGELSLGESFWGNYVLLNVLINIVSLGFKALLPPYDLLLSIWVIFVVCVFLPWQLIGLWRASSRHSESKKRVSANANAVKAIIILTVLYVLGEFLRGLMEIA